ncbi:uncharacterized protein LOC112010424 isoform X2 [Quercus suber]|uniref:uncharacterized protein LOC112010424 isoform X2 n=1 Tax=Quercus suber TaxID=58331 RepID=UPI0032DF3533
MTNKGYRPASNDLNIIFLLTTSVKECNEESELIPMHAFEFATYNCINNRLNDNSYLTDMIGKLTAIGPIEQVHCDSSSTNIKNLQILLPDYKLQIQVNDHTGIASFVLFDKDAEKIIQKTTMDLSLKNQEPNKVPQEIQNLLGKSYTFQIKVDNYNVKEGWEVYTVTSVFKSESNKHSENIVTNNIQIKPSETLFSHHQTMANNPIATSDIKLLTSLKDVTDDNLIDDVFGNTQLKDLTKKKEPPSKLLTTTQAAPRIRRRSDCISYVLIILLLLCNTYGKIKLVH